MADVDKKLICENKAITRHDMEEYNKIELMKEGEIPIERAFSGDLTEIFNDKMSSDFEQVDISDLWKEDENEMRRKFER